MKATRVHHQKPARTIAGLLLVVLTATSLGACAAVSQASDTTCPEGGIRFGADSSGNPAELEDAYAAFGDALAEELGCAVGVRIFDSHAGEVEAVENGELEIARFSALGYAVAAERVAVTPVVTFGMPNGNLSGYTAGIWVPADSAVTTPAQLEGRTLALGAEGTTSGDLLPRGALADANLSPDQVRISYAGGGAAALDALRNDTAEAAVIDSRTLAAAVADGRFDPDVHRQIWESGVIPNDPIVLSPHVDEELAEAIVEALLDVPPEAIEQVAASAGVDPGGKLVGVDEVTYAEVVALVDSSGIGEEDV
ncbi:phosphate/phosphite/phosphonate ABC transporter substrate-binding protein [Myceligenerans pegani]|uniref:Phosphate/phosphite/phosphonate ABC transporter substrate-binding protein n=1 Tax=Myceligenerans pegani TaxID=2776917 RepID=A0ABR9MRZ7_9MICO|nr:phosphate/phosphite/phosphonate ABC transporter substrate-binding protein [Myceligenerans sp. TRM 65318]MBE1874156.1 phosphate/phosphite/phosphonate ABC transporter substrate-binding protein [Myceligenerans sp. TRM 65318]MBE3016428.1 phosphate/phosphite/phosphonate ABC transporter substrate-binding protein [Myceligenerans sp. TRM 65318]